MTLDELISFLVILVSTIVGWRFGFEYGFIAGLGGAVAGLGLALATVICWHYLGDRLKRVERDDDRHERKMGRGYNARRGRNSTIDPNTAAPSNVARTKIVETAWEDLFVLLIPIRIVLGVLEFGLFEPIRERSRRTGKTAQSGENGDNPEDSSIGA